MFEISYPAHLGQTPYHRFSELCEEYLAQNKSTGEGKVFRLVESQAADEMDFLFDLQCEENEFDAADEDKAAVSSLLIDTTISDNGEDHTHLLWVPHGDTDLSRVFPATILNTLSHETGCSFDMNLETRSISIKGALQKRAYDRVSNVERNSRRQKVTAHTLKAEKMANVYIKFPSLIEQPDDLLLRTLAPRSSTDLTGRLPWLRSARAVQQHSAAMGQDCKLLYPSRKSTVNTSNPDLLQTWSDLNFPSRKAVTAITEGRSAPVPEVSASATRIAEPGREHETTPQRFTGGPMPLSIKQDSVNPNTMVAEVSPSAVLTPADQVAVGKPLQEIKVEIQHWAEGVERADPPIAQGSVKAHSAEVPQIEAPLIYSHTKFNVEEWERTVVPDVLTESDMIDIPRAKPLTDLEPDSLPHSKAKHEVPWVARFLERSTPEDKNVRGSDDKIIMPVQEPPAIRTMKGGCSTQSPTTTPTTPVTHCGPLPGSGHSIDAPLIDFDDDLENCAILRDTATIPKPPLPCVENHARHVPIFENDALISFEDPASCPSIVDELTTSEDPCPSITITPTPIVETSDKAQSSKSDLANASTGEVQSLIDFSASSDSTSYKRTMGQQRGKGGKAKSKAKSKNDPMRSVDTSGLPLPEPPPPPPPAALQSAARTYMRVQTEARSDSRLRPKTDKTTHKPDVWHILDHARSLRGVLQTEVQLGQILIRAARVGEANNFVRNGAREENFDKSLATYESSGEVLVQFSPILTSSTIEACQIVNPELFEQTPFNTEVFYEFVLNDKNKGRVHLKVYGESDSVKLSSAPKTIGRVLCHFPRRVWDASVQVIHHEDLTPSEAMQQIIDTLEIEVSAIETDRVKHRVPRLKFRVQSNDVSVESVYTKRNIQHRSKERDDIYLYVTENRLLDLKHRKDDHTVRVASSDLAPIMVTEHSLWYEASLRVARNPLLDQNLGLELGVDAQWTPDDVLDKGLLDDLNTITEQLITRLDGVGGENHGPRGDIQDLLGIEAHVQAKRDEEVGLNQPFW
ncbi:hypothetical protein AAFC00_006236 [Neodothiora populina]|uniref:Uncharacterized protein n=1 Tax=Neodothiora populina TaxID=2781224 RepID=A0ABR3P4M4_9PEZI